MTTYATDVYSGTGSQVEFAVTFPFIQRDQVHVYRCETGYVDVELTQTSGVPVGDEFQWQSNILIQVGTAPSTEQTLKIKRITPVDQQLVQWDNGSYLVAADLNTADLQLLYLIQEQDDRFEVDEAGAVTEAPDDGVQYGRQSKAWTPTLPEAPNDGKEYARKNEAWAETAGFPEAPVDNKLYGRENAGWAEVPDPGIADAPIDNKEYARLNGDWVEIPEDQTGVPEAPIGTGFTYGRKNAAWVAISEAGGITYKGTRDLTLPAPTSVVGDFYVNTATSGVVDASWTGLGGDALTGGERVVYDGTIWDMLPMPEPTGVVVEVVAGNDITVNDSDPAKPVVSVTPNTFLTSITAGLNITVTSGSTVGVTPASFIPYNISTLAPLP